MDVNWWNGNPGKWRPGEKNITFTYFPRSREQYNIHARLSNTGQNLILWVFTHQKPRESEMSNAKWAFILISKGNSFYYFLKFLNFIF